MSRKSIVWSFLSLLICIAIVVPASAQHFKQLKGTFTSVSAGRNEVFGIDASQNVWRINAAKTVFAKVTGASGFAQVAVGGGSGSTLDDIWGLDTSHNIYRFNYKTKVFDAVAGVLVQIAVGEGVQDNCHPYEVWGVVSGTSINRYSYCTNSFELIQSGPWTQVTTSGGTVVRKEK